MQTLLRVGEPISQLAYVEVHLHVQPDNHIKCELIRVSQHSKALQALGLQDASPSKPAAKDAETDTQPVQAPAQSSAPSAAQTAAQTAAQAAAESAAATEQPPTASQPAGVQSQAADQHSSVDQQSEAVHSLPALRQSPFRSGQQQQPQQQPQQPQQQAQQQQSALSAEVMQLPAGHVTAPLPAGLAQRRLRTVSSDMTPTTVTVKSSARHNRQDAFPAHTAQAVLLHVQSLT